MTKRVVPLPAVAAGQGPFAVTSIPLSEGGRSAAPLPGMPGLFAAPLGSDCVESLAIRQHEYGHLGIEHRRVLPRFTVHALQRSHICDAWIQSGLDVIVNGYMLALGNDEIVWLRPWTGAASPDRSVAAMNYIRCEGMAVAQAGRRELVETAVFSAEDCALLHRTAETLWSLGRHARPISVNQLVYLLARLQRVFGPDSVTNRTPPEHRSIEQHPDDALADHVEPGVMEIARPPMLRDGRPRRSGRSFHAGYAGSLRYPCRALLPGADGRAFAARRRIPGGAMLIDCSGSMSLDDGDIERLLAVAPVARVALYASCPDDLDCGRLVVVATQGRVADLSTLDSWFGAGNVVDIPALQWLSRQPHPRVWISDGGISGVGDRPAANLTREAADLVRKGCIKRFESVAAYLPARRRGGFPGSTVS